MSKQYSQKSHKSSDPMTLALFPPQLLPLTLSVLYLRGKGAFKGASADLT